ncbi:hypothetical protein Nepgr_014809 [Nepenthes gracilis]|uniref:Uncharacterized protein n=1 Tax=Nepenthes gracilis TaxID=150966 RepID=A0AAD3SKP2_NEPGR|nr:hypothetical protein Nepgr_014809 [Nepenthes gracilis]
MDPGYLASTSRTNKANQQLNTSARNIFSKQEEIRDAVSSLAFQGNTKHLQQEVLLQHQLTISQQLPHRSNRILDHSHNSY